MDSEEDFTETDEYVLKLDTIPPEIFLHICNFLSAKFVINVLSKVCEKFRDIIENDTIWKMRIFRRWPKRFPLTSVENFDWKEACIIREEHHHLWQNSGENMKMYHLKEAHFGSVNVVQILQDDRICASGGRDGALKLWDIAQLNEHLDSENYKSCLIHAGVAAHGSAWLWSIVYDTANKMLFSGGFDCFLKSWQLENPSVVVGLHRFCSPILCLAFSSNAVVSGCYNRGVSISDPRVSLQPVHQHGHHKKPVICVATDDKFIISGSEDKSIIVYDKVARKVVKTLQLDGFPLSMSYKYNQLLVGDVLGHFHVIDPAQEKFDLVKSYESGHKVKVTGIQHSLGSIITCSTDKTIRILEPNFDPRPITVLECASEISRISAYKTTLVSANTDDSITVWLPKEELE